MNGVGLAIAGTLLGHRRRATTAIYQKGARQVATPGNRTQRITEISCILAGVDGCVDGTGV